MKLFGRKDDDDAVDGTTEAPSPPPDARVEDLPPPEPEAVQPDVPTPEEAEAIAEDPQAMPEPVSEAEPEPEPVAWSPTPEPVAITTGPAPSAASEPGDSPAGLPAPVADVAEKRPEVLVAAAFAGAFILARILKRITSD